MTIEESGCGLSHESAQNGRNGTCVELEASKATWSVNKVRSGDPQASIEKNSATYRLKS